MDVVECALDGPFTPATIRLRSHGGRDQVAAQLALGGWASFESPLPRCLVLAALRTPGTVVDVGANTGLYALLAAAVRGRRRVIAVEPDPLALKALADNIALNTGENRIEVCPIALSDRGGKATLFIPTQQHGLIETSASLEAAFNPPHSAARTVRVDTLDSLLGGWREKNEPVGVVKIDVESHEPAVLRGASGVVRRWRPLLFVEVLGHADTAALEAFLAEHRYVDVVLRPDGLTAPSTSVAFDHFGWNHAFLPAEQANALRDAMAG